MDLDKSLYMKEFMDLRSDYGSIINQYADHTLFTNLYDEFKPKQQVIEVKEIIEEIEEKTIHLLKKEDQPAFFDDLPELTVEEIKPLQEENFDTEVKVVQVGEDDDPIINGGSNELKTISINSNYLVSDK